MADAQVSVRFTTKDTEVVKRALKELGEEGQKALDKIERAGKAPSAELRSLNAAVAEGKGLINGYAAQLGPMGAALKAMGPAGLAAAAAITGLGLATKSTFAEIAREAPKVGAIAEVAKSVGFAIESLQEYRFAANQAGVPTADFDRALQTLTRRIGDAVEGQGELVDIAQKYRISLVDVNGQAIKSEEAFRKIVDVMPRLQTQAERLQLAYAAFGRGQESMANLASEGTGELNKQAEAARRLGLVISAETVRGAKELADTLEQIEQRGVVARQKAVLGDNPELLAQNAETVARWNEQWNTAIGTIENRWARFVNFMTTPIQAPTWPAFRPETKKDVEETAAALSDMEYAFQLAGAAAGMSADEIAKSRKSYDDLIKSVDKAADIEARRKERINQLWEQLSRLVITQTEFKRGVDAVNAAAQAEIKTLEKKNEVTKTANQRLTEQVMNNNLLIRAYQQSELNGRIVARTQDLVAQGFKGSAAEVRRMAEVLVMQEDSLASLQDQWASARDIPKIAKEVLETPITRALENTVDGIKDSFDDLWFDIFRHGRLEADDFLGNLLDAFARTLAEMATLALARPIIVPMISGIGNAMNLSPGQINALGSQFGIGDAAGLASLARGGFSFASLGTSLFPNFATSSLGQTLGLSTAAGIAPGGAIVGNVPGFGTGAQLFPGGPTATGNAFNNLTSPAGMLGGIAGSMLASMLFTPRKGPGNEIGGMLGAIAGSFIPVPFLGTAIGSFLGSALGGLFGAKPSSRQEVGTLFTQSGQRTFDDLGPSKNNPEAESAIRDFLDRVEGLKDALEKSTGGKVGTGYTTLSIDGRTGTNLILDGQTTNVASIEDAVRIVARTFVTSIEGIEPDIKAALDKIDWTGDLQKAAADVDFVTSFQGTINAMKEGALSIKDSVREAASANIRDLTAQIKEFKDSTARLGLSVTDADEATRTYVERMLGLGEAIAPQSAAAQGLEAFEGILEAIAPLLSEVRLNVTPTELRARYIAKASAQQGENFRRRYNASAGYGALNDLSDLTTNIMGERRDAGLFGTNTADLEAAFSNEISAILTDAITGAGTLDKAIDVLGRIRTQFAAFPEVVAAVDSQMGKLNDTLGITEENARSAAAAAAATRSLLYRAREAQGAGFINNLLDLLQNDAADRQESARLGLDPDGALSNTIFAGGLSAIVRDAVLQAGTVDAATAALNSIKANFAAYPAIIAAADLAFGKLNDTLGITQTLAEQAAAAAARAAEDQLRRMQEAQDRVAGLLREETELKLDAAKTQSDAARNLLQVMSQANARITAALRRFELDPSISMLTPMASFDANQSYFFNDLARRAQLGNPEALAELAEAGPALVQMARQVFGSTSAAVDIQQRVRAVLEQARDLTGRQTSIAQMSLDTATASLDQLKLIASLLNGGAGNIRPGGATTTADLDALIGQYNQAAAVGGPGFVGSASYGVFVSGANRIYAGMTDTGRLVKELDYFQANLGGPHGAAYAGYVDTITSRLRQLGVPGYAAGGDHRGGLAIYGERGPEIGLQGPMRFLNAGQTQRVIAGAMADAGGMGGKLDGLVDAARGGVWEQAEHRKLTRELVKEIRGLREDMRMANTMRPRQYGYG